MNAALMEELLNEEESSTLDFKLGEYLFDRVADDVKSELLKDILAFANAWRRTDAYILIGVDDVKGGRGKVVGVSSHLDDARIQQFVNSKSNRPVIFSYEVFPVRRGTVRRSPNTYSRPSNLPQDRLWEVEARHCLYQAI
jgi:predicted HTH transcriptional regulator